MRKYFYKCVFGCFAFLAIANLSIPCMSQEGTQIDSLKKDIGTSLDTGDKIELYKSILPQYYYAMNYDSALYYGELLLDSAASVNDTSGLAFANQMIAFTYDQRGYVNKALPYIEAALEYYIALGDSADISNAYNDVGYFKSYSIDQSGSLVHFMKSLSIAKTIKDTFMISYSSSNIGYYYEKMKDYDDAYFYHKSAFELDEIHGDSFDLSYSHGNMALILSKMGMAAEAVRHIEASKSNISSGHIIYDKSNLINLYIDVYLELKELDSVSYYIDKQKSILKDYTFLMNEAYLEIHRGRLSLLLNFYEESISHFQKSIELLKPLGEMESQHRVYDYIANAYELQGDFKFAYLNYKLAEQLKDSVGLEEVLGILSMHEQELIDDVRLNNIKLSFELEKQQIANMQMRSKILFWIAGVISILLFLLVAVIAYFLWRNKKSNTRLEQQNEKILSQQAILEDNLRRIQDSEDQLRALNSTKDRLFSIIAHDLRNPLSSVVGLSDLYLKNNKAFKQEDMKPMMESLNQSASYGFNMLENLLEWARSNTGALEAIPEELDLCFVIDEMLPGLRSISAEKHIEIKFLDKAVPPVLFDRNMLHTVIRNLIHNAIKFSHEHSFIELSCEEAGNEVVLVVRDQGIGISAAALGELFSSESQYQRYGTKDEKGTGLGLLLCEDFVMKNGGRIWAESEEGKGSKFSFTLPVSSSV